MRVLAMLSDNITTDHISPSGAILPESDAGQYLQSHGIAVADFNSYGTRRGLLIALTAYRLWQINLMSFTRICAIANIRSTTQQSAAVSRRRPSDYAYFGGMAWYRPSSITRQLQALIPD